MSKIPHKVLDAPDLRDDFYLNVVDWSDANNLAVALSQSVYIWSATNSQVARINEYQNDLVASLAFSRLGGSYLAVGTHTGIVDLYDVETQKVVRSFAGHRGGKYGRVGALSWSNSHILSSGAKDRCILNRDMRQK